MCYITLASSLVIFIQTADKDKASLALPDPYDDTVSDIVKRPSAFIKRMLTFEVKLKEIKVNLIHAILCVLGPDCIYSYGHNNSILFTASYIVLLLTVTVN